MTLTEMKAKMYDLIVMKQRVEMEMQAVNQEIVKLQKETPKETNE